MQRRIRFGKSLPSTISIVEIFLHGRGAETWASRAVEQCSYSSVISAGMYCGKVGSLEFLSSSKVSLVTVAMLITIVLLQAWQL